MTSLLRALTFVLAAAVVACGGAAVEGPRAKPPTGTPGSVAAHVAPPAPMPAPAPAASAAPVDDGKPANDILGEALNPPETVKADRADRKHAAPRKQPAATTKSPKKKGQKKKAVEAA